MRSFSAYAIIRTKAKIQHTTIATIFGRGITQVRRLSTFRTKNYLLFQTSLQMKIPTVWGESQNVNLLLYMGSCSMSYGILDTISVSKGIFIWKEGTDQGIWNSQQKKMGNGSSEHIHVAFLQSSGFLIKCNLRRKLLKGLLHRCYRCFEVYVTAVLLPKTFSSICPKGIKSFRWKSGSRIFPKVFGKTKLKTLIENQKWGFSHFYV